MSENTVSETDERMEGRPVRDFVRIELQQTLDRFYERREQLRPALESAAELDKIIPKLEKLLGAPAKIRKRHREYREDVVVPPEFEHLTNAQRIRAVLLDFDGGLAAPAIAAQAGIAKMSIGPCLNQMRMKHDQVEIDDDRVWRLTESGKDKAEQERAERSQMAAVNGSGQ